MRKISYILSTLFIISFFPLNAAFEDSVGSEELIEPQDITSGKPFTLNASFDYIGYSHMEKKEFECTKIRYNQLSLLGQMVFWYRPCYHDGAIIEAGYTRDQIVWPGNPFFNQTTFNTADLGLIIFSNRLHDWLWTARVGLGYDTDRNDFTEATNWDILMWGRYDYCRNVGLHIGFLALTGMRIDQVYPILGFDWEPYSNLTVNAVFPVNMSIVYDFWCNWSVAVAARVFYSRHRLSREDVIPFGLVTYRSTGIELRLAYEITETFEANIHAGATLGGQLKVANQKYKDKRHFDFKSAPYAGAELSYSF